VFLGDEVYLQAGRPLPAAAAYEGFPIAEDGIGLVRRFEDGFARARVRPPAGPARRVTVVSGTLYAPRLTRLLAALAWPGLDPRVVAVPNEFFGGSVAVAGLLTGQDIQRRLATCGDLGEAVLVPAVALRDGDGVFLDDLTPADLARALGVEVVVAVAPEPRALLRALRGN
jgi:NifB/MoaA-like Fe-S oxidoreductase